MKSDASVEIINRQRRFPLDVAALETFAAQAIKLIVKTDARVSIALTNDRRMCQLNREFRGKDKTTDVLSFPFEAEGFEREAHAARFLGDIAISVEQAARQASENGLTLERELQQLVLHGLLHLCGYDHEQDDGEMNRTEMRLRRRLGI